jgi:hypothetical protein
MRLVLSTLALAVQENHRQYLWCVARGAESGVELDLMSAVEHDGMVSAAAR